MAGDDICCPRCGRPAKVGELGYAAAADTFVCLACAAELARTAAGTRGDGRRGAASILGVARSRAATAMALALLAAAITTGGILLSRSTPVASSAPNSPARSERSPRPVAAADAPPPATPAPTATTAPATRTYEAIAAAPAEPSASAPTSARSQAAAAPTSPTTVAAPAPAFVRAPLKMPRGRLTDEQVGEAIQQGVDFLLAHFHDGELRPEEFSYEVRRHGLDALCVYALASSGKAISDPRLSPRSPDMVRMLEKLKTYGFEPSADARQAPVTYGRALRACALATFDRPQDREQLRDDVDWLINAATAGTYTYDDRYSPPRPPRPRRRATTAPAIAPNPLKPAPPATRPAPRWPTAAGDRDADADAVALALIAQDATAREARARLSHQFVAEDSSSPNTSPAASSANALTVPFASPAASSDSGAGTTTATTSATTVPSTSSRPATTTASADADDLAAAAPPEDAPAAPSAADPNHQKIFRNALPKSAQERRNKTSIPWDNSNAQYGLLGVWAGAEVGVEVPERYWRAVQRHWATYQLPTGEWNYAARGDPGRYGMTVAGVASLLVTHDFLVAPSMRAGDVRQPYSPALNAGLSWLEDHALEAFDGPRVVYRGYNLFGMERVGLASGFKQFGAHDWFVELTLRLLDGRHPNGSFGKESEGSDAVIDTAYALLFLSRGRHPILYNKLRFDGPPALSSTGPGSSAARAGGIVATPSEGGWTNRPREIANLARFVGQELERPINWQIVDIERHPDDWADAPILYLASHRAPAITAEHIRKLRTFVDNGGILFTHADAGSPEFNAFAGELALKMFPTSTLKPLPTEHAVYTLNYVIDAPRPRLQAVTNGVRLLMVHSPTDLSAAWQTRSTLTRAGEFQLGANIYLYATGKERFRNRLDTPLIPALPAAPSPPAPAPPAPAAPAPPPAPEVIALARLRYAGNWDPEPGAWPRLSRLLEWQTGVRLDLVPVAIEDLAPPPAPAAPVAPYASPFVAASAPAPAVGRSSAHTTGRPEPNIKVAHLTGTEALDLSDAQLAALQRFVAAGGTLLVESAGGSTSFSEAAESAWLPKLVGRRRLESLPATDPLLRPTLPGTVALPPKMLRLYAMEQLQIETPRLRAATLGRGRVIFSPLDLTSGLLGTNTWGVLGFLPDYSESVARNLVLTAGR